jgi:peroxiredoxin
MGSFCSSAVRAAMAAVLAIVMLAGSVHAAAPDLGTPAGASRAIDELKGKPAPVFTLRSLDGPTVRLADYKGKVVLLNFWATWCAPCRVEMPMLAELHARYRSQGFEVIGISMDDGGQEAEIAKFVATKGVKYPILLNDGKVGDAYAGARFLPQTFLIDRSGKIVDGFLGLREKAQLAREIESLE